SFRDQRSVRRGGDGGDRRSRPHARSRERERRRVRARPSARRVRRAHHGDAPACARAAWLEARDRRALHRRRRGDRDRTGAAPVKPPIDFYFDFSSPYGYFAANRIDALAAKHGRAASWHPILLGAVFKISGQQPLSTIPLKGDYMKRDLARTSRLTGIAFNLPAKFPIAGTTPSRAYLWVEE